MKPPARKAILWFRRDLRLADNPALDAALRDADEVVAVFIFDPAGEAPWAPGAASRWWLHHSLIALDRCLRGHGSRLVVRSGDSAQVLANLVAEVGANAVHWNAVYEPAAAALDARCRSQLRQLGVAAQVHAGALLHDPQRLRTVGGEPYRVFTPFWNALRRECVPAAAVPAPSDLKPPSVWPESTEVAALGLLPQLNWAEGMAKCWTPGEAGALSRLERFAPAKLARYGQGRDFPARDEVSRLSPHLHFGEISPRQVWLGVQARSADAAPSETEAYCRQLAWREFAHHLLVHFPQSPEEPLQAKFRNFGWRTDYGELLRRWQRGRTGYPLVDAGMRELWATGWMHNRARMVVASFLVKNLRIPWQEGARWFWDTLVDADLANNTLGWQWCAGCGADAAPYFRIFNPHLQAQKFDGESRYIRTWIPELVSGAGYPAPMVDLADSRKQALEQYQKLSR